MEENKNIDSLFRSSLEKFEMVPSDDIWTSMDIELTKKQEAKSKKRNRVLLLFLFLLLLGSFVAYYFQTHSNSKPIPKQYTSINKDQTNFGKNTESNQTTIIKDTLKSIITNNKHSQKDNTNAPSARTTINTIQKGNKESDNSINKVVNDKRQKHKSGNIVTNPKKAIIKQSKPILKKQAKLKAPIVSNKVNDSSQNADFNNPTLENKEAIGMSTSSIAVNENNTTETSKTDSSVQLNIKAINDNIVSIQKEEKALKADSTVLQLSNEIQKDTSVTKFNSELNKDKVDNKDGLAESIKIKDLNFKRALYFDFTLSPIYTINYLRDNTAYKGSDNAIDYRSREKSKFSFSTGMAIRYDLNKKWGVSIGAYYSTIAYSMALSTVYAYKNSNAEVHFQYPTSWGTIEIPNQPNYVPKVGDSLIINSTCNQLLKVINIPLIFRYSITKSRFSLYTNIGASANFTIQDQAVIKTGTYEFSYTNSLLGKRKINFSLILGVGMQYKFTNRLAIFIEPSYRASITSVTQDIPVNCFPQSLGLNTGISFQLR